MAKEPVFKENADAVQAHLSISQSVIQRMAENSASSKGWCIAIVSAILVVVADKGEPDFALIAILPTILFLAQDAYYLGLEKRFRNSYNSFIQRLHKKGIEASDLFAITPKGGAIKHFFKALGSFSVWPFYTTLIIMIFIVRCYII
ncbi:MAG: hypothetical protein RLN83_07925 [Balneola sp.]|tara:strand:- start:7427 stop:7864 length:438 start_codon:yes stop_codon:yes gene_type:complete